MNDDDCTIVKVRSVDGGYELVTGHAALLARLSMGKRVVAEDVDTGDRMKIVMNDGRVVLVPIANPEIAETIAGTSSSTN